MKLEEWELLTENGNLNPNQQTHNSKPAFSIDVDHFANSRITRENPVPTAEENSDHKLLREITDEVIAPPVVAAVRDVIFHGERREKKEKEDETKEKEEETKEKEKEKEKEKDDGNMHDGMSPRSSGGSSSNGGSSTGEHFKQEMPNEYNYTGFNIFAKEYSKGCSPMWRATGIGALCFVGVAAATVIIIMFGRNRNKGSKDKVMRKTREMIN